MIHEQETKEIIMLAFRAIKFGEAEFLKAVQAYLKYRQNAPPQHGKVKLKELMQMDQGATMMEIRPEGVRGFQRIAKKYNVDFSITKDRTQDPPAYQVFFKGRDQDVIAKAFNEYVNKQQKKAERVPFTKKLQQLQEKADILNKARAVKDKHRSMEKSL